MLPEFALAAVFVSGSELGFDIVLESSSFAVALVIRLADLSVSLLEEFFTGSFVASASLAFIGFVAGAVCTGPDSSLFCSLDLEPFAVCSFVEFWLLLDRTVAEPVPVPFTLAKFFAGWPTLLLFEWLVVVSVGTGESVLLSVPPLARL